MELSKNHLKKVRKVGSVDERVQEMGLCKCTEDKALGGFCPFFICTFFRSRKYLKNAVCINLMQRLQVPNYTNLVPIRYVEEEDMPVWAHFIP